MKLVDFIEHIASVDFEWTLEGEAIVWPDDDCCPIWAMYSRHERRYDEDYPIDVYEAGRRLGLTDRQVACFISAADRATTPNKELRKRLLAATVNKQDS